MEKAFNRLLALVDDQEQPFLPEETLNAKFFVSIERGQYLQDLAYREELAAYYQELGRVRLMSRINLAYSYLHNGQFQKGRALLLQTQQDLEKATVENDYRLAFCFHILASLALAEDEFEKAVLFLQNAKVIYEIHNILPDIAGAHSLTGMALVGQGDLDSARPHLLAGLKITLDIRGVILLGESLLAISLLFAHQGETYRARELYELIWRIPRFQKSALYDAMAGKKIRALTNSLSPDDLQTIHQQAAETDPWQEAASLYKEILAAGWAG
jgi:tetratricopeptide (TPR) repeat protein